MTTRILHHPSRAALLPRLLDRLNSPEPVEVFQNEISPWDGMRRLLRQPFDGDHLLVLQDDAIVCDGFYDALAAIRAAAPDRLVALFHAGQPRPTANEIKRAPAGSFVELHYVRGSDWTPSVALLWPRPLIDAFRRYRWAGTPRQRGDDLPLGQFARFNGGAVAAVPSIVEHPDDSDSVWRKRRARNGRDPLYVAARFSADGSPWVSS